MKSLSAKEYLKVGKPVDRYFEKYYQTWEADGITGLNQYAFFHSNKYERI